MMVKEECFAISRYGGNIGSYAEIAKLPVYERRMLLNNLARDAKKQQEEQDKMKAKAASQSSSKRRKL
jgi:hypothetical protein